MAPSVEIWIDRDATLAARTRGGKSLAGLRDLVATFAEPVPLYRIIDGEELARIVRTRRVSGGFFAVPSERAHGASWAGSLESLVSWGRGWQPRLGKDLFVLELDGDLRPFYHLGDRSFDAFFDPHGPARQPARIPISICNTGLGCSLPDVFQHDIAALYRVTRKDELARISWDQAYAYVARRPAKVVQVRKATPGSVHYAGTIHGVDVEVYLDQDEYRPGSGFNAYDRPSGEPYHLWQQRKIEALNPYRRTWTVETRDGRLIVRGASSQRRAVAEAARVLELDRAPAAPADLLPRRAGERAGRLRNPAFAPLPFDRISTVSYSFAYEGEPYVVDFEPSRSPVPLASADPRWPDWIVLDTYIVSFQRARDVRTKKQFAILGTGGAVPILGTVAAILRAFVAEHQPEAVGFTAELVEPSRVRLYRRMLGRIQIPGYLPSTSMGEEVAMFFLVREDVRERVAARERRYLHAREAAR
jgi:hypothetical protein